MLKAREAQFLGFSLSIGAFVILLSTTPFLQGCAQPVAGTSYTQKSSFSPEPDSISSSVEIPDTPRHLQFAGALNRYGPMVQKYADQFDMDWVLVLAVMKQESKFNHDAVSHRGAYGLMQIMPMTQLELIDRLGIDETVTPRNNIKAGIFHLRSLYGLFHDAPHQDRIRLMLAAYNGGLGRVQDAQRIAVYMGNDPNRWESVKDALPLLTRSNYTLHRRIWEDGRPQSGYFRNWRETVEYVESVMEYFQEYTIALR